MTDLAVLHLISNMSGGGAERQCVLLMHELRRRGHRIGVGYLHDGPQKPDLTGIEQFRITVRGNYDPWILVWLIRVIRRFRPKVVQSWILQMDVLGGMAARVTGVPWILCEPSCETAYPRNWKTNLRSWVSRFASAIVSNSKGGDAYWASRYRRTCRLVIPNGVDVECSDVVGQSDSSNVSSEYKDVVLCAGRLIPGKNVNRLVEAFSKVRTALATRLVICGEGILRGEVERQVNLLGLDGHARLTGFLPPEQLFGVMRAAAVLVSLSEFEGSPNVIAEAMACECPLILSDIPAHRYLVPHDCGVFVNPDNVGEIAEAIEKVLQDRNTAAICAKRAKARIEPFSVPAMATQYEQLYSKLVPQSQRPGGPPVGEV